MIRQPESRCGMGRSGRDGSEPHGIEISRDGLVWFSDSGVKPNTSVRFDPKSQSFSSEPVPSGGGTVRHVVATNVGQLYLSVCWRQQTAIVTTVAVVNAPREVAMHLPDIKSQYS